MLECRIIVPGWKSPHSLNSITVWYFSLFKWSQCSNYHNIKRTLSLNLREKGGHSTHFQQSSTQTAIPPLIYPNKTTSWIYCKSFSINREESLFLLLSNLLDRVQLHSFIFVWLCHFSLRPCHSVFVKAPACPAGRAVETGLRGKPTRGGTSGHWVPANHLCHRPFVQSPQLQTRSLRSWAQKSASRSRGAPNGKETGRATTRSSCGPAGPPRWQPCAWPSQGPVSLWEKLNTSHCV